MYIPTDAHNATQGKWLCKITDVNMFDISLGILKGKTYTYSGHIITIDNAYFKNSTGYIYFTIEKNSVDLFDFFKNKIGWLYNLIETHIHFYKQVNIEPVIGGGIILLLFLLK